MPKATKELLGEARWESEYLWTSSSPGQQNRLFFTPLESEHRLSLVENGEALHILLAALMAAGVVGSDASGSLSPGPRFR